MENFWLEIFDENFLWEILSGKRGMGVGYGTHVNWDNLYDYDILV